MEAYLSPPAMNDERSAALARRLTLLALAGALGLTAAPASAQRLGAFAGTAADTPGPEADGLEAPSYLTPLVGPGTDNAWDIAVDATGNAYIAGMSDSRGDFDAVVVKLDPNGAIAYVAWIGGSALDQASKIAVDADGSAYIAGYTFSSDFPTTAGAYDETFNGGGIDAFVAKLSPDGSQIEYATFLGGSADDFGGGIAVDAAGQALVTGYTESSDFPTTLGALDRTHNGSADVIVARLNPAGSALSYSSFIGGREVEIGYDVALGPAGETYLTGQVASPGFPVTPGVVGPFFNGGVADAFVLKLSATGALAYSTFLGGEQFDDAKGIAVDAQGNAVVTGRTDSFEFPTTAGAFSEFYSGGRDVFVTRLSPGGTAFVYSTYVGGGGEEESGGIVLGPDGAALVAGWTFSPDFPVSIDAFDTTWNGDYDAFLLALDGAGSSLDYGTFLGTAGTDYGRGIGTDESANAYLAGYSGFGNVNAFGLKLDLPLASDRFTGMEEAAAGSAAENPAVALGPALPNPFSSRAALAFTLPEPSRVRLAVYDVLGREVVVLVDGPQEAGTHGVTLDGSRLPAGTYFVRLEAGVAVETRSAILMR
jgi:hypothetical protein